MRREADVLLQILGEAWAALRRNPTRSILTMLGIVWGIAAVALLIAYGGSFRADSRHPASTPSARAR